MNREILSVIKKPIVLIISLCILTFLFHPKWMNVRLFFRGNELIPLHYVTNFYLWTRSNKHAFENIFVGDLDKIAYTRLRARKTYILIHGFTRNGLERWIINMKNALLWKEDCNVISVDWESGALSAGYYVIRDRVPMVGEDVSKLVTFLQALPCLKDEEFHIIGHSLGAHIAGFAGKLMENPVKRITGLDPASLGFNGLSKESRLDKSDASFVDVIHTHGCYTILNQFGDCFGTYDNIGHVDFWPNGGEYQPACDEDGDGKRIVREGSSCDHGMAPVYFTESIRTYKTSTRFLARKCPSYTDFNLGSCNCSLPQYMGFNANPEIHGIFYLNTSKTKPYGLLEPYCSAGEISIVKILGLVLCIHLVIYGAIYSMLSIASVWTKKDLVEETHVKLKNFLRCRIKPNEKSK